MQESSSDRSGRTVSFLGIVSADIARNGGWYAALQSNVEDRPMDSVVHFEMPYENRQRMAKFYQAAFGWKTEELGEDMGN